MEANTKDEASVYGLRDDGADAGTVSIAATTTGLFDSGAISVAVATGSLICAMIDTSASSEGNYDMPSGLIECEPT